MLSQVQSKFKQHKQVLVIVLAAVVLAIAVALVRAAAPHVSIESEGMNIANAVIKNASSASGGKYVEFVAPASGEGPDYPGQPKPGTVLWGTSLSGAEDPYVKHEQPAGKRVGIRRTFQPSWSQRRIDNMVNTAKGDVAVGRIPWVSIKSASWASMASGAEDQLIDYMLKE